MKLANFLGFVGTSTRRLPALALAALAGAGFIACSDSKTGESENVATAQSALSGGTDPVVRYSFNEASGTLASDSSGNGHSATLINGATFVAGARGNAVRINGGTQRVDLPPGVVQRCDDLTIAARVNLAANSANWTRIFDIGANTNSYMFLTPRAGAANILRFGITTSGGAGEQLISHTFTHSANEPRGQQLPRILYGGVAWVLEERLSRITTRVGDASIKPPAFMRGDRLRSTREGPFLA